MQPKYSFKFIEQFSKDFSARWLQIITAFAAIELILPVICVANVVGTDFQNFNPTTSGIDFVTVQSSETLEPGFVNMGLFINYARNPLPELSGDESRTGLRNAIIASDISAGMGVSENMEIGINFPLTVSQQVFVDNERLQFDSKGFNEIRLFAKHRIPDHPAFAMAVSSNFNLIKGNPYTGDDSGPTINLEAIYTKHFGPLSLGINLGHRWRNPGSRNEQSPVEPLGNQYIGSIGLSYLVKSIDTIVISELFASEKSGDQSKQSNRLRSSAESILGFKILGSHGLAWHGGIGTFLEKTSSSPDLRIYAGVNWTFGEARERINTPPVSLAKPEPKKPKVKIITIEDIQFAFDSDQIVKFESKGKLKKVFSVLDESRFIDIEVAGHTDSLGNDDYNLNLSQKRANRVRQILIDDFGLPASKVRAVGYGESQPIASNKNHQGRSRNRRVDIIINFK